MSRLLVLLIFTPALPLAVGGWTMFKENRAAKRKAEMAHAGSVVAVEDVTLPLQGGPYPVNGTGHLREANEMGRLICLVADDHHELLDWHLQDSLPDVLKAAADHFHVAQADVLLDRDTMAHLHMQESCCRELLTLLLC